MLHINILSYASVKEYLEDLLSFDKLILSYIEEFEKEKY